MSSAEPVRDLCFVVMPFGTKSDAAGPVAFDIVYRQIIAPAVEAAGLEVLRADEEITSFQGVRTAPEGTRALNYAFDRQSIIKNAKLVIYKGAPHGMCTTLKDRVNEELLAFVKT